ncbi:MAG: hypothetical protein RR945_02145 [Erysipelotrichaceae bacterium]
MSEVVEKKVLYGNEGFGYAEIDTSTEDLKFKAPIFIPGIVSTNMELEEKSTNVPGDNSVFAVIPGAKIRKAEIGFRYIPAKYAELALGYKTSENGMLIDTNTKKQHCIFWLTKELDAVTNEETDTLHYLYCVMASETSTETTTTGEDEVEALELVLSYNATKSNFVKDAEGKFCTYGKITRDSTNSTLFDSYKNKVLLPTDAIQNVAPAMQKSSTPIEK